MASLPPAFLLDQLAAEAPWCATLDNLELSILLLAQPWVAGAGLRRADLERQLSQLDMPVGPVYFQRVKRAVARLEEIGALRGLGEGRTRSFVVTPEGFAALLLNLCVLHADPTLDGSEFELKRSLVAMLNLLFERLSELPEEGSPAPETARFFDEVERLTVFGEPAIGDEVEARALDVLRLIAEQRAIVERLLKAARERLERTETEARSGLDLGRLAANGFGEAASLLAAAPAAVRELATGVFPRLAASAAVHRYDQYLGYLDELAALYAAELKTVGLQAFRQTGRGR